nr:hypothetical protein [Tanacetum cinerariifolium]
MMISKKRKKVLCHRRPRKPNEGSKDQSQNTPWRRAYLGAEDKVAGEPVAILNPSQEELMLVGRLLPEMTLCQGNIRTFRLGHMYKCWSIAIEGFNSNGVIFIVCYCLPSCAFFDLCGFTGMSRDPKSCSYASKTFSSTPDSHRIPSSLLFLCDFLYKDPAGMAAQKPYSSIGAGLVLRGSNSKWVSHGPLSRLLPEMTLCRGNIGTFRLGHSIMGDISYAVFVDSHRIPSSLLFLCGFLYRDPAGMAAQKPYSSTGAGLVLRGSNSKWYQHSAFPHDWGDVVVPSVFFMKGSIIQDILERRIDKCDEEMEIP